MKTDSEIITCSECRYGKEWFSGYYCRRADTLTDNKADDFCSRAERENEKDRHDG